VRPSGETKSKSKSKSEEKEVEEEEEEESDADSAPTLGDTSERSESGAALAKPEPESEPVPSKQKGVMTLKTTKKSRKAKHVPTMAQLEDLLDPRAARAAQRLAARDDASGGARDLDSELGGGDDEDEDE